MPERKLGEILVEKNLLCQVTLDRVIKIATKLGKRTGAVLEEMGLITEDELAQALALQYNLRPLSGFAKAGFPPEVLAVLPAEVALGHMLFPLKLDGNRLALAMADPTNTKIVENIAANKGLIIVPYISTKSEIKRAICKHYFGLDSVDSTKKTVLIVEDEKTTLGIMKDMLSKHYLVITAADGIEAYKEVITRKPHVVLTDEEMPKLNGFGLLSALRAVPETKQIPIILISGAAGDNAEAQAFGKGFFDFISKPVKEITLLTRVKRAYEFSEKHNYLFLR